MSDELIDDTAAANATMQEAIARLPELHQALRQAWGANLHLTLTVAFLERNPQPYAPAQSVGAVVADTYGGALQGRMQAAATALTHASLPQGVPAPTPVELAVTLGNILVAMQGVAQTGEARVSKH